MRKLYPDEIMTVCGPKSCARIDEANPTKIGVVNGIAFFECPFAGDEGPLLARQQGRWVRTTYWELPEPDLAEIA